jgi:uncharacterized membrane protein
MTGGARADGEGGPAEESPDFGDLIDEIEDIGDAVTDPAAREQVREAVELAVEVQAGQHGVFGRVIHGFDRADAAEALLGAVLLGIPMLVEGGTQEVGSFLAGHPALLAGTYAFAVGLAVAILYIAEIQDVRVKDPILGVLPRRLVGVLVIPLLVALAMMTAWGRADWATPWLAFCQASVAYTPMVIGAALGDILPGS